MPFSTAINTELLTTYLERRFIPALENELQYEKFCTKGTIPGGMGNVIRWNIFDNPTAATTALAEGTTTAGAITINTTPAEATLAEFGEHVVVTRLADYTTVRGSRNELAKRLEYGAALTIDTLIRSGNAALDGATDTTVDWYCAATADGGTVTAATPTAGSAAAIIGAAEVLRSASAIGHTGVAGHPNRHLAAIVSTTFERDMVQEATAGRMTWAQAVTQVPGVDAQLKWVNGYMGSVYGTACYRTQNVTQTTVTSLADESYIIAEGGLGCVSVIDSSPRVFVNGPSSGDVGNPYRNRSTVAWHAYWANDLIDANRVIKMYSLA